MKRGYCGLLFGLAAVIGNSPAVAGVYTDDLARCLVGKSTEGDKTMLMQWIFAALAASPAVRDMAAISDDRREQLNRQGANLFVRLIADVCREPSVNALKYEGAAAFEAAFNTLGQVAARGLMTDPIVASELGKLETYMDKTKLEALGKEAGVAAPDATPAPAGK